MRLGLAATALIAMTGTAAAELRVCNDSGVKRSLAIGYSDNGVWTSEGWWNIEAGDCAVPIPGPLRQRYIYWRATTAGEEFAHENFLFCVTPDPFTIVGDTDCTARGYDEAGFRVVDTGTEARDFTLTIPVTLPAPDRTAPAAPPPAGLAGPIPADGPAFAPGTHGEPFTETALMQDCGATDEGFVCILYLAGTRFAAYEAGAPDRSIIAALVPLAPNTPVEISGDIVTYGDITAEVLLSRIAPGPTDPKAALRRALQGDWVSTDDGGYTAVIRGAEIVEAYAGEVTSVSTFVLDTACGDGTAGEGDILTLREMGGDPMDARCWAIETVTADALTVFFLPRGNILSFRRP